MFGTLKMKLLEPNNNGQQYEKTGRNVWQEQSDGKLKPIGFAVDSLLTRKRNSQLTN